MRCGQRFGEKAFGCLSISSRTQEEVQRIASRIFRPIQVHYYAVVIDEQGQQIESIRVDHTPQGFAKLTTFLQQIIGSQPKEQMACIIETTHGLLIAALLEAGWPKRDELISRICTVSPSFYTVCPPSALTKRGQFGSEYFHPG